MSRPFVYPTKELESDRIKLIPFDVSQFTSPPGPFSSDPSHARLPLCT